MRLLHFLIRHDRWHLLWIVWSSAWFTYYALREAWLFAMLHVAMVIFWIIAARRAHRRHRRLCAICAAIIERHDYGHPRGTGCGCLDDLDGLHRGHER